MAQLSKKLIAVSICMGMLAGCATVERKSANDGASSKSVHDFNSVRVSDFEEDDSESEPLESIPIEMNSLVQKWIDYFQGRGRPHMERYLARSTRYSKVMKQILRQNGLPEDLIYIAMIESGFSSKATSRAAAVGYWQFIRGTGKRYGLEINALVDERRDPILATQAAAEYFKGLYSVFGSWYLAMASYNVGENRVKKEVMNHYTRDFWELARKKRFPSETINYVPKYIAAKMIGNDPKKYGFTDIDYLAPIEYDLIKVERPVNLKKMAELLDLEYDDFKQLNPKFKGEVAPVAGKILELRVPAGMKSQGLTAAAQSVVDRVEYIADAGETQVHRVRQGESLYLIARKYRTTVAWLKDVNDLKKGRKLRIGQKLFVPDRSVRVRAKPVVVAKRERKEDLTEATEKAVSSPEIVADNVVYYVVQAGDNLTNIADQYDSSVEELRKMNKLSKRALLKVGMRLKVPKDEGLPAEPGASANANAKADSNSIIERAELEGARQNPVRDPSSESNFDQRNRVNEKILYKIKKNETWLQVARKFGTTVSELQKTNGLQAKSALTPGMILKIPSPKKASPPAFAKKYHVVRKGENLTKIADYYQVSLRELKTVNKLRSGSKLIAGMRLRVPTE